MFPDLTWNLKPKPCTEIFGDQDFELITIGCLISDMSKSFGQSDLGISSYVENLTSPEADPIWKRIRQSAADAGMPSIHVGEMDGQHLEVLSRALKPQKVVEIGTLAGYSGIRLLRGMNASGMLYTFEFSRMHAEVARRNFVNAGVAERTKIYVGPAIEQLPQIEKYGPFDLVFIDADKTSYPAYLEWTIKNLRSGGVLLADNVFGWGGIAENMATDPETIASVEALRKFNARVVESGQFTTTFLPTAEGLLFAVKN